jgi:alpha-beta hydrolase superfamily lysophospholipase
VVIAQGLVDAGIAALLFDLNGHCDSSLDTQDGETGYIADLIAMFRWASEQGQLNADLLGIAGSSLGGAVALHAVIRNMTAPTAMVLRAPPVESHDLAELSVPTLVVVGSRDPLLTTLAEVDRANKAVSLCVVKGASHLFEEPGTLEVATNETVRWFREHLCAPEKKTTLQ